MVKGRLDFFQKFIRFGSGTLPLSRNHDLEIQTNQMFKFQIHADYVLYHDYDKIIIINEDDFDHDEKGLRG